jgi:hypothetical protein
MTDWSQLKPNFIFCDANFQGFYAPHNFITKHCLIILAVEVDREHINVHISALLLCLIVNIEAKVNNMLFGLNLGGKRNNAQDKG